MKRPSGRGILLHRTPKGTKLETVNKILSATDSLYCRRRGKLTSYGLACIKAGTEMDFSELDAQSRSAQRPGK